MLQKVSYKNKILFSTVAAISLLGVGIFLLITWLLLPDIPPQVKLSGLGIAQDIAEKSSPHILTENIPELKRLIFDVARLEEQKAPVAYIFILNREEKVLVHTLSPPFPEGLSRANPLPSNQSHNIRPVDVHGGSAYDIAVPIREKIDRVGSVHIGVNKYPIDNLIGKLVTAFLLIVCAIVMIGFLINYLLSRFISRPILDLRHAADKISGGDFDVSPSVKNKIRCWEIKRCGQRDCPAYGNTEGLCWHIDGTLCCGRLDGFLSEKLDISQGHTVSLRGIQGLAAKSEAGAGKGMETGPPPLPGTEGKFPQKLEYCKDCIVYAKRVGDEIVQLADSFSNMTHRLRASEAVVRMSEERYRAIFNSTPNSIFVLEPRFFKILDANERAEEVYGWKKAELIKKSFMDLGPYPYADGVLSTKDQEPSVMSSVYQKIQHYRRDGTPFYVNIYARRTKRSHKYGIVVVPVDITENLEKESQLIQARKLSTLGEMASGVAHEVNQPLAAIQIGADFIYDVVTQPKEIPRADLALVAEQIREQIDRAVRIVKHLREFGRKAEIKKEKVYINKPIEGVFTLLGQQLKVRDIKVVLELGDDLPPIEADSNRLEQVFIDLVINARDAMEEKKEKSVGESVESILKVRSFLEKGWVVVTVSDTGPGILDNIRDKIFEPFFTTKGVGKGTGLGLSISYSIVKDYGGTIEVESEEGKGANFKIAFPACDEGQDAN